MLAAAFCIASLMCSDDSTPVEVVQEPVIPEVQVIDEPAPEPESVVIQVPAQPFLPTPPVEEVVVEEVKPVIHVNMEPKISPEYYQEQLMNLPPLHQGPTLAEVFMYEVLHRPNIQRMQEQDYRQATMQAGDIAAYIWVSNSQPPIFLQYGTICTAYGDIYVVCTLDENGNIADLSKPLEVYYDNPSLRQMVSTLALDYQHRFPLTEQFSLDAVKNIDDLNFLFGNTMVAEDSYNVAFLL